MIESVRRIRRNVKRWQNGDMCLRWTAAGMLEAEQQFGKIIGHTRSRQARRSRRARRRCPAAPPTPPTPPVNTPTTAAAPEVAATPA